MTTIRVLHSIADLGLFLAHAVELESEAADRYDELADRMEAHDNRQVARLFRDLAGYSRKHRDEIGEIAAARGPLPLVAPWEFQWGGSAGSPEAAAFDDALDRMTPHRALEIALECELRAQEYYAGVAVHAERREIAELARLFAAEERVHAAMVRQWMEDFPAPAEGPDENPGPRAPAE
jgi:rubrerythrin